MRGSDRHAGSLFSYVNLEERMPARHLLRKIKGYDNRGFAAEPRRMCAMPHLAAKPRPLAIDGRTTRHAGSAKSQRKRKLVEEALGWGTTVGPLAKTMLRSLKHVCAQFTLTMVAYSLAKLPKLLAA